MYAPQPEAKEVNAKLIADMELAKEVITGVRAVRASKNIHMRDALTLNIVGDSKLPFESIVRKLAILESVNHKAEKNPGAASFLVGTTEYNIPLENNIDVEAEIARLEKDLAYNEGFLASVLKKLNNDRFVNGAPAQVVENERKKQADAESKIANLKASIASLKGC